MASTYTLNNGIELIGTGEQSGTWGSTTNDNLSFIDTALDGQVTLTATSAGTSGSPNTLPIADGTNVNSEGRNRLIIITSGTDLGSDVYYQLTPNDAKKILYIRNDLNAQDLILFQGTYNSSNDYVVPNGTTAIVFFNGDGSGAVAANVFNNAYFDSLRLGSVSVDKILDEDNMASDDASALATQQSIKAYVDSQVGAANELSEILANGNTTGGNNILITSGDSIAAPDASGTNQTGTDVIVSGGAGTGTGAGGEVLFKVAPAGSTGSSVNALATGMKLDSTKALYVDTINELTSAAGVTIDSVLLKDDVVNATDIETSTISANDGTTAINIADSTGAVDIDTSLNVDGTIEGDGLSIIEPTTNLSVLFGGNANSTTSEIKQRAKSSAGDNAEVSMKVTGAGGEAISAWEFKADTASGALTKVMDIDGNGDFTIYEADGTTASFFYDADTGLTVNNGQNARNFIVKSDNNASMLYVDGTNDKVGVGTSSVSGNLTTKAINAAFDVDCNETTYGRVALQIQSADDVTNDVTSAIIFSKSGGRKLAGIAARQFGDADQGGLDFYTQPSTSGSAANLDLALQLNNAGYMTTYSGAIFNTDNVNADFQVKSVNKDNMFFVDAANDRVGVGAGTPNSILDVKLDNATAYDATDDGAQRADTATILVRNDNGTTNSFAQIAFDIAGTNQSIARIAAVRTGTSDSALSFVTEDANVKAERLRIEQGGELTLESNAALHTLSTATSATTESTVYQFSATTYTGAKLLVCVTDSTATERYITELLVTHDGTTAVATEYGQVATDTALATFDVDISGGYVRLRATPASSNSMTFKVMSTQLLA